jgi:hypothetical protein
MKILDSLHKLIKINSTALIVARFDVSQESLQAHAQQSVLDAPQTQTVGAAPNI